MKRPAFQFYPADWRKDNELGACGYTARGLWWEMLCVMHEAKPYGHMARDGVALSDQAAANLCRFPLAAYRAGIIELEANGVLSRTTEGVIYSRRMVRDEELRNMRAGFGKLGGNPDLVGGYHEPGFVYIARRSSDGAVKIGISVDPVKRIYKLRQANPTETIELISRAEVEDMGTSEAELHDEFKAGNVGGEWFILKGDGLSTLMDSLKAKAKGQPTPSSAVAFASSPASSKPALERIPNIPAHANGSHGRSDKPSKGQPQEWTSSLWVNATAKTLGIPRRNGERDEDFADRVHAEVDARQRKAKHEARRHA